MMLKWQDAVSAGPSVCGGKGYNLGRLERYGFRIPDGGVLSAEAYRLTQHQGKFPPDVRAAVRHFLRQSGLSDAPLAVRSSATAEDSDRASFAGIHTSVLNVRGPEAVERAILSCYDSLGTEQARAYRAKMGLADEEVACAVVICRMVDARCAGVAFSADPLTGRRDLILVDAAEGLGDRVVSGQVNPQRFVFRVPQIDPIPQETPANALLSPAQATELARTVLRIHWDLGDGENPQDIEWAHDGERLWVLQARPITRLPRAGPQALRALPQYWSRANVKDSIPGVLCELSWSAMNTLVATAAFGTLTRAGYEVPPGVELVRRFLGRVYFDTTFLVWAFVDGFGMEPQQVERTIGGHQPPLDIPVGNLLKGRQGRRRQRASLRLLRALSGFEKKHAANFRAHIAEMKTSAREDLSSKSRAEIAELQVRLDARQFQMAALAAMANAASGRWSLPLEMLLARRFGPRATALVSALAAGSGDVTTAEQGYRIAELARIWQQQGEAAFRPAFEAFLDEYGHRAIDETDMARPRWIEDPEPLLRQIREAMDHGLGGDPRAAARDRRLAAEREVRARMPLLWPLIAWMARGMRRGNGIRELAKSSLISAILPYRQIVLDVGRRLVANGLLDDSAAALDLTARDLRDWMDGLWDGRGARELTEERRSRREQWLRSEPPDVVPGEGGAPILEPAPVDANGIWRGIAASPGGAEGVARVVMTPEEGGALAPGEILVAPSTHPGWTPLFLRASAVVMETGGYLSHGAIVAREYGLPAVVNLPGFLRTVQTGDRLTVNGDEGTVSKVGRAILPAAGFRAG